MPFVTEELWQNLKRRLPSDWQASESIMVAPYPEPDDKAVDPAAERVMESVIEIIRSIRNARVQYDVESSRWIEAQVYGGKLTPSIIPYSQAIETLARVRPFAIRDARKKGEAGENNLVLVLKETEVVIPMESMVDVKAERKRLETEIEQSQAEIARLEARLKNKDFLSKAPAPVIERERQKRDALTDRLKRLRQQILQY
jgi:valyl-tRNA synthetase